MRTLSTAVKTAAALLASSAIATAQPPTFSAPLDLPANHAPRAIAVADLSGDGWPDLVLGGTVGTTSALAVNLEECSNCGVSGWGWEDDGWGAVNRNGVTLRFPNGGPQTIRIQTREDGVSIDQIVLSSGRYKTARPGAAKNDTVLLQHSGPYLGPNRDR